MPARILAVAEVSDGALTKLSAEVATLARCLAEAAGGDVLGLVVSDAPDTAANELASYLPRVLSVGNAALAGQVTAPHVSAEALRLIAEGVTHVLLGATVDGRDVAGTLAGLTDLGILANADEVTWDGDGLVARSSVLGGKTVTRSTFAAGSGIVTVRPGGVTAAEAGTRGTVESREPVAIPATPAVAVLERVSEAGAEASLEDARVVVVGGRGVGGPDGFELVEDLAALLGGVSGATRAAVDAGWVPYARQIGQTGRVVKPALYLGLGVSGAMQHRVGMQGSEAIVAVNKDPDAPLAEIADLLVVGDLFAVGTALALEIRARRGA
jgi:electron transfer flavoprotein alpha subunit